MQKSKHRKYSADALRFLADRFKVLSEPTRLQLLMALEQGEQNVTRLIKVTSLTQANVSKHLAILLRAGMVRRRKEGAQAFYFISDRQILQLCDLMCAHIERDFAERARHF